MDTDMDTHLDIDTSRDTHAHLDTHTHTHGQCKHDQDYYTLNDKYYKY